MKLPKNSVSGVALIIVLGFLVIISGLAVAFFSSVNTEMKASRNFAAGVTTRQLADSSVQIVMGQISAATTRGIDSTGVGAEAWASQPGMIRVYGSNTGTSSTASSSADAFFKLYSSDKMILTGGDLTGFNVAKDYNNTWDKAPALWTDLNAPVLVQDPNNRNATTPRFPIIDPRAYGTTVDPSSPKWGDKSVEGFYYNTDSGLNGVVGPGNPDAQRLPMPVRWIYVLQDGTLTVPDNGGSTTASFSAAGTGKQPTAQNPIVGRVAFWTDDETCKLNLNTAAGFTNNLALLPHNAGAYQANPSAYAGSFWDTPRFYTEFDHGLQDGTGTPQSGKTSGGLALCQLLQNEFQRYPGHPATTSLAPVLSGLLTSEQLYSVVPRYSNLNMTGADGSTDGGTWRIFVDPITTAGDLDNKQLQPKQDRLYASVDEFLYGAKAGVLNTNPSYTRATNNTYAHLASNPITPDLIDKLRFFVTTQSRAPELNLYGQPRVTAWPVRAETATETSGMNVFDSLITFCSTIGNSAAANGRPDTRSDQTTNGIYRYIFARREVATTNTTPVSHNDPLGGPVQQQAEFNASYTPDWKIARNTQLLSKYLSGFLTRPIPGVGKALSTKYSAADQQSILTEIFDYIRLANSQDTTTSLAPPGKAIMFAPRGYVPPSVPTFFRSGAIQAKGFGRMSTICEATLVFYYAGPQMDKTYTPPSGLPANTAWSKWDTNAPASRYVQVKNDSDGNPQVAGGFMRAFLLFSTFDPMQGYAPKADPAQADPKLSIEATWSDDFRVVVNGGSHQLGFPVNTALTTTVYRTPGSYWGGRNYGGYEGFMHTLHGGPIAASNGAAAWTAPYKIKWDSLQQPASYLNPAVDMGETYVPSDPTHPIINKFSTVATTPQAQEYYPFQTPISAAIPVPGPGIVAPGATDHFDFFGAKVKVNLYYGGSANNPASPLMQTINLNFQDGKNWPVPQGPPLKLNKLEAGKAENPPTADVTTWAAISSSDPNYITNCGNPNPPTGTQGAPAMRWWYWTNNGGFFADMALGLRRTKGSVFSYQTSLQASWAFATRLAWCTTGDGSRGTSGVSYNPYKNSSNGDTAPGFFMDRWRCIVQPGDTIRSLLYWDGKNANGGSNLTGVGAIKSGDLRLAQASSSVLDTDFAPHPDYDRQIPTSPSRACVLRGGDGNPYFPVGNIAAMNADTVGAPANVLITGDPRSESVLGNHISLGSGNLKFPPTRAFANLPWSGGQTPLAAVNGVVRSDGKSPGDWDNGVGDFPDGPFCNKQDEGNVIYRYQDYNLQYVYPVPYFTSNWSYQKPGNTFTSPSRQMPSPAMFGSLPSQVPEGKGWQTLCFSPNPAGPGHPGNVDPKDHYVLDLFQMPVVEPYPISEPFSTAGKINLNYRIAPFDYIRRSTALRGALYPLRVTAVPSQYQSPSVNSAYLTYKTGQPNSQDANGNPLPISINFRQQLDRDKTIQSFDGMYDAGLGDPNSGFFKSATQICERYLYSTSMSYPGVSSEAAYMQTWWTNNGDLTGDNEREKPYVDLYPRITTKSNTYTVHMRVQTLRQSGAGGSYSTWVEGKDNILGEYRGSATIERYIDPADPRFSPSNANPVNPDLKSVEPLYRFRTVINKKFSP